MTGVSIEMSNVDTDTDMFTAEMPSEHEGGDWGDVSLSHEYCASKPTEAGREAWKTLSFTYF